VGPREVGKSDRAVWMANRTQVQNELEVLHCIIEVRDTLACVYLFQVLGGRRNDLALHLPSVMPLGENEDNRWW